jgi:hypothetical protein
MTKELLLLHLAQAEQSLDRAKNNFYSDKLKEEYHNNLSKLFTYVKEYVTDNASTLSDSSIYDIPKKYLDFIFKSLEFLDSSTLNQIPYEIVACLNHAMTESLEPSDNFIIVTSLINNVSGFSYDSLIAFDHGLYTDIETRFGIKFTHRLVQINLPKAFSRDYLAAVVLYHELGHFIDMRFSLMSSLARNVLDNVQKNTYSPPQVAELLIYFPFLNQYFLAADPKPPITRDSPLYQITLFHLMEYFCDLFASQYIGEASNYYLSYITRNRNTWVRTHPSTTNRVKVVADYLAGTNNIVVTSINEALTKVRGIALQKKYEEVPPDDFLNLVPVTISTGAALHGIINLAWRLWLTEKATLFTTLNTTDAAKVYSVINNLVEKSIGNFMTLNIWKKAYDQINPASPKNA